MLSIEIKVNNKLDKENKNDGKNKNSSVQILY